MSLLVQQQTHIALSEMAWLKAYWRALGIAQGLPASEFDEHWPRLCSEFVTALHRRVRADLYELLTGGTLILTLN